MPYHTYSLVTIQCAYQPRPQVPQSFSHALIRSWEQGYVHRHISLSAQDDLTTYIHVPDEFMEILGLHDREPHAWIGVKHNR